MNASVAVYAEKLWQRHDCKLNMFWIMHKTRAQFTTDFLYLLLARDLPSSIPIHEGCNF